MTTKLNEGLVAGASDVPAFAWRCAAQMFHDVSAVPLEHEVDPHWERDLAAIRAEAARVAAMPDAEWDRVEQAAIDEWRARAAAGVAKAQAIQTKVAQARNRIASWRPEGEHMVRLKRMMLEQADELLRSQGDVDWAQDELRRARAARPRAKEEALLDLARSAENHERCAADARAAAERGRAILAGLRAAWPAGEPKR